MEYQVIVPNLERRIDRWLTCLGVLMGQGVPLDDIIRFCSYDASDYTHIQEAKEKALAQHDTPYFREDKTEHIPTFCCRWTFYSVLHAIAHGAVYDKRPTLMIVDDLWMTKHTRRDVCRHLDTLSRLSEPLRMIQYDIISGNERYPIILRKEVPE